MSIPFIDTNVIIRYLTGDDPEKQAAAASLFEQIESGQLTVYAPDTVIADAVYVLASPNLYRLPRHQIADLLSTIVGHPGFRLQDRRAMLYALQLYGYSNVKFDDAYIAASMRSAGAHILYSWDRGFDRLPEIERREP